MWGMGEHCGNSQVEDGVADKYSWSVKASHDTYAPSSSRAGPWGPCWDGEDGPRGATRPGSSLRPGTRHALGTKAQAAELSWRPEPGHLEGQISCLTEDVARDSKCDRKMWGLVVWPRELGAQAVRGQGENWALWHLRKTKGCKDMSATCLVDQARTSILNEADNRLESERMEVQPRKSSWRWWVLNCA